MQFAERLLLDIFRQREDGSFRTTILDLHSAGRLAAGVSGVGPAGLEPYRRENLLNHPQRLAFDVRENA